MTILDTVSRLEKQIVDDYNLNPIPGTYIKLNQGFKVEIDSHPDDPKIFLEDIRNEQRYYFDYQNISQVKEILNKLYELDSFRELSSIINKYQSPLRWYFNVNGGFAYFYIMPTTSTELFKVHAQQKIEEAKEDEKKNIFDKSSTPIFIGVGIIVIIMILFFMIKR